MSWHKLAFPLLSREPVARAFQITTIAQSIDNQTGKQKGFAIFSKWESGKDNASTSLVLYFSPVAASLCLAAIPSLAPCDKPDAEDEGTGIAYGDLQGSASWDLLK